MSALGVLQLRAAPVPVPAATITVNTATDNCGASSQRSFLLTVQGDNLLPDGFEDPVVPLADAAASTSASLRVPVAELASLPPLGTAEVAVLTLAVGPQTYVLQLRGDGPARQGRLVQATEAPR